SVTELPMLPPELGAADVRAPQYAALGNFLVRQVDVVIAIWDGQVAAGPGGTAVVVGQAIEAGCLVIWIDPADPATPKLLDGDRAAMAPRDFSRPLTPVVLTEILQGMLLPLAAEAEPNAANAGSEDVVPSYFKARWPGAVHWAVGYSLLRLLGGGRRWKWPLRYDSYEALAAAWTPFLAGTPKGSGSSGGRFDSRIRDVLLPRSVWADALAWYYGQLYRSAYVTTFILGGLAVPVGLCYLFFASSPDVLDIKAGFATAELAVIMGIVLLVRRGGRRKWHKLWLETREMSELLRLGRSLAYVGELRELTQGGSGKSGSSSLPVLYARATFREIGLPNAVLDSDYLRMVLGTTLETELREQKTYHEKNAAELERIDHALHRIGNACFTATVLVTAAFLGGWVIDLIVNGHDAGLAAAGHEVSLAVGGHEAALAVGGHEAEAPDWGEWFHEFLEYFLKPLVSILAAGLPAFGAAFAGIRAQSNFGDLSRRSEATFDELSDVEERIASLTTGPERKIGLASAAEALLGFTHAMAADLGSWRQLYVQKPLVLPG
ncbi:MAG TPA: hypothetical protein VMB21_18740, partial [Candidatus Limnocylindria bacterium]|nr:hypothetical protein [Candidatus Limnocylindria bacterium]